MYQNTSRLKNRKSEMFVLISVFAIYMMAVIVLISENSDEKVIYQIMPLILILLYTIRHYLYFKNNTNLRVIYNLIPIAELICIHILFYNTDASIIEPLYVVFVTNIIMSFSFVYGLTYAYLGYIIYYVLGLSKNSASVDFMVLFDFIMSLVNYSILVLAIAFAKIHMNRTETMKKLMSELEEKTAELEKVAVLSERNRIAGEMHDTVGHTLTTVIVELEACKLLFDNDKEKAKAKLNLASEQVRTGLTEMRGVVKKMSDDGELHSLVSGLEAMATELLTHTDVHIELDIADIKSLIPIQEKVLYRMAKESVTNAIKHGKCDEILITLSETKGFYNMSIIDNGVGASKVEYGFGLTSMEERVIGLGGELTVKAQKNEGCSVSVKLPKNKMVDEVK